MAAAFVRSLQDAVFPRPSSRNYCKLGRSLISVSLGVPDGGVHPRTQAALGLPRMHPDITKMLTFEALCQPILGSIDLDFYNYIF
jgi:hypothetical protein